MDVIHGQYNCRDVSIDILKGIGIVLVLVAHSIGGYIHTFAYSFHMPLFFIVTGYFYKPKPIKEAVNNDFLRLFVPFFFTAILMFLLSIVLSPFKIEGIKDPAYTFEALVYGNASEASHKIGGGMAVVGSVWFLPALFWAKTVFNIIVNDAEKYIVILCLLFGGIAAGIGQVVIFPYSILQGITALPFLLVGWKIRQKGGVKFITETIWHSTKYSLILLALFFCWFATTFINSLNMASLSWNLFYYPNLVFSITGTYFIYLLSSLISNKTEYLSMILAFLGKYSIILICFPVVESYFIPLQDIIPSMPYKHIVILACKTIWCIFTIIISFNIPFLRRIFSINNNLLSEFGLKKSKI